MSKPTKASINLGNETHARGFNDGLNARPKTIKKTHAHAHRYHIGYRLGEAERLTTMKAALATDNNGVITAHYRKSEDNPVVKALMAQGEKEIGFFKKLKNWMFGG